MAAVDGAKWAPLIAADLNLPLAGVNAVIELLLAGNTVPFIARYRKEKTGALDEVQIATIQERHAYVVEMEDRRKTILESIESQGKLTEELKAAILKANTKSQLEDLYLPYKPKRRTRAMIARERRTGGWKRIGRTGQDGILLREHLGFGLRLRGRLAKHSTEIRYLDVIAPNYTIEMALEPFGHPALAKHLVAQRRERARAVGDVAGVYDVSANTFSSSVRVDFSTSGGADGASSAGGSRGPYLFSSSMSRL